MGTVSCHPRIYPAIPLSRSYGFHEGGDEEQQEEHHCSRLGRQSSRVLREEAEDRRGPQEERSQEEQARQSCLQEGVGPREEELCKDRFEGLEQCCERCSQGTWPQGLRGNQRQECSGEGLVCQGEVTSCLDWQLVRGAPVTKTSLESS